MSVAGRSNGGQFPCCLGAVSWGTESLDTLPLLQGVSRASHTLTCHRVVKPVILSLPSCVFWQNSKVSSELLLFLSVCTVPSAAPNITERCAYPRITAPRSFCQVGRQLEGSESFPGSLHFSLNPHRSASFPSLPVALLFSGFIRISQSS